jgi:hypothetical protein
MWFEALSSGWAGPELSLYKRSWALRELSDSTHGGMVRCLFSFRRNIYILIKIKIKKDNAPGLCITYLSGEWNYGGRP